MKKQCRNCLYGFTFKNNRGGIHCGRKDPSTGLPIKRNSCEFQRRTGWLSTIIYKTCGKQAKYFELKVTE